MRKLLPWMVVGIGVVLLAAIIYKPPQQQPQQQQGDEFTRLMTRGNGYLEKGDATNAAAIYAQAVKMAPDSLDARLNLANAYLLDGDGTNVIEQCNQAIALDHNSAAAYYLMGCAYLRLDEAEQAVQAFQQSKQIDPAVTALNFQLGLAQARLSHVNEAITEFETIVQFEPEHPSAHYQLSQLYQRAGRTEDAARELQKHQQIQAKNPGGLSGPAIFERCKYTQPRVAFNLEQPEPKGIPVRFTDATSNAFSQSSNYHGPMAVLDYNHDGRNSLFVMEGEKGFRVLDNKHGRVEPMGEMLPGKPNALYPRCRVGDLNNGRV